MYTIGILESGGGLSAFLAAHLPPVLLEGADLCPAGSLAPFQEIRRWRQTLIMCSSCSR